MQISCGRHETSEYAQERSEADNLADSAAGASKHSEENFPADSGTDASKHSDANFPADSEADALAILRFLQDEAVAGFPSFSEAFGSLLWTVDYECDTVFETDGLHLYFQPQLVRKLFLECPDDLRHAFLHVYIHCLCLHIVEIPCGRWREDATENNWDAACDLSAELMWELLMKKHALCDRCCQVLETVCLPSSSAIACGSAFADSVSAEPVAGDSPFADPASVGPVAGDSPFADPASVRPVAEDSTFADTASVRSAAGDSTFADAASVGPVAEDSVSAAILRLRTAGWLDPRRIIPLFSLCPELYHLAKSCAYDSHKRWARFLCEPSQTSCSGNDPAPKATSHSTNRRSLAHTLTTDELELLEALQKKWDKKKPKLLSQAQSGQRSKAGGKLTEEASLSQRDSMDYRKFLRQFAVPREEAILDMDSFDYIPYYYGLECYAKEIASYRSGTGQSVVLPNANSGGINSNGIHSSSMNSISTFCVDADSYAGTSGSIPFIEPLEYSEVHRLDELAIAIDTSGSCSGKIVRRFLEETWSILRQRENFFSKMRLHLIQCDLMIQEHRIFTSVEEWENYLPDLKIHGHGDTDFTPVFEHLEKLIAKREIRHLRGLLYFTDGDGIYPKSAPSFDTAFVFLNDRTEKHAVPDWAIRLNLHLPDEF